MTVGTLEQLGAVDGMPSVPSLRRFIASQPNFPVIQRGRYGTPYILDLETAADFVRSNWRDGRNERTRRRLAATSPSRQLPLALGDPE